MITKFYGKLAMDKMFGGADFTKAKIYIGLSSTPVLEDGTGITEPVGDGYSRVMIDNTKATFTNADDTMVVSNKVEIKMSKVVANKGTAKYVFISDAITGGNILVADAIGRDVLLQAYSTVVFEVGDLKFSLTNK